MIEQIKLKHPHHGTFHKTKIPDEKDKDFTRFYRWHIDAALYDLAPPRVTSLYAISVPKGRDQTILYDDGSNDELKVPLGTTAFVSGKSMFEDLLAAEKSLAVRSTIVYSPHPYVWMKDAASNSVGLGLESEGKELPADKLPEWENSKIKKYPMVSTIIKPFLMRTSTHLFYLLLKSAVEESGNWPFALPSTSFRNQGDHHRPYPVHQ